MYLIHQYHLIILEKIMLFVSYCVTIIFRELHLSIPPRIDAACAAVDVRRLEADG